MLHTAIGLVGKVATRSCAVVCLPDGWVWRTIMSWWPWHTAIRLVGKSASGSCHVVCFVAFVVFDAVVVLKRANDA